MPVTVMTQDLRFSQWWYSR